MNKPKLIIIEGAQGVGKSTIATYLRTHMTSTNLHSLSGVKNNDPQISYLYHLSYLSLADQLLEANTGLNLIYERSYLSERVYCALGYKGYDFINETTKLNTKLDELSELYDVYVFILTANKETYEERLVRDKPTYQNANFKVENSLNQEREYLKELTRIAKTTGANTYTIDTSGSDAQTIGNEIIKIVNRGE